MKKRNMNKMKSLILFWGVALLSTLVVAEPARAEKSRENQTVMMTEWGAKVTPENAWREYPRPQMVRENWTNLNGLWKYTVTDNADVFVETPSVWRGDILVPFPIESALSGVGKGFVLEPTNTLWYTRTFTATQRRGERTLLHFEQVDFRAMVFVNGREAGIPHEGGQVPFTYDITDYVNSGENVLTVAVWDPTDMFHASRGKQASNPRGIWYTRTSGIGGTVWLETVPSTYVTDYRVTTDIDRGTVSVTVMGEGNLASADVELKVMKEGRLVATGEVKTWGAPVTMKLAGDVKLWSVEDPQLYDLIIDLEDDEADTHDIVKGYFGMRKVERRKDAKGAWHFYVNNKPCFLLGTLDQGWWPDGLLTPPSDEAMAFDILALKKMGYNCMRKHIKVEPRRYYYLCDKLGLMVLQDMPSGSGDPTTRYGFYRRELKEMMDALYNVPSIVMWVPYNEAWGQPDAFRTVSTLRWVKAYDPTRLLDGPSGYSDYEGGAAGCYGHSVRERATLKIYPELPSATDAVDQHDYAHRPKLLDLPKYRALFLGEFGGIGCRVPGHLWTDHAWGYNGSGKNTDRAKTQGEFIALMEHIATLAETKNLAGAIYTQTTDVEREINGLITYDRKVVKFDEAAVKAVHDKVFKKAAIAVSEPTRAEKIRAKLESADRNYVFVIMHRGDWRNYPENSEAAIRGAIEKGADVVELDVAKTKDGHYVLMHDNSIDRATNGKGLLSSLTLAELKKLKLRDGQGGDAPVSKYDILTLEEAFAITRGKILVNIDKFGRDPAGIAAFVKKQGMTREVILKGAYKPEDLQKHLGDQWADYTSGDLFYMPILGINSPNAEKGFDSWQSCVRVPGAYELCFSHEQPRVVLDRLAAMKAPCPRIWINTLWDSLCAGHTDERGFKGDAEGSWGWCLRAGATMIQTDRPAELLKYLNSLGRHTLD